MLAVVHSAAGASCGLLTRRSWLAIPLAVLSHTLLDQIRHEDPISNGKLDPSLVGIDGLLTATALALLAQRYGLTSPAVVAAVAACAPDLERFLPSGRSSGDNNRWYEFHSHFEHSSRGRRRLSLRQQFLAGLAIWGMLLALSWCGSGQA